MLPPESRRWRYALAILLPDQWQRIPASRRNGTQGLADRWLNMRWTVLPGNLYHRMRTDPGIGSIGFGAQPGGGQVPSNSEFLLHECPRDPHGSRTGAGTMTPGVEPAPRCLRNTPCRRHAAKPARAASAVDGRPARGCCITNSRSHRARAGARACRCRAPGVSPRDRMTNRVPPRLPVSTASPGSTPASGRSPRW